MGWDEMRDESRELGARYKIGSQVQRRQAQDEKIEFVNFANFGESCAELHRQEYLDAASDDHLRVDSSKNTSGV